MHQQSARMQYIPPNPSLRSNSASSTYTVQYISTGTDAPSAVNTSVATVMAPSAVFETAVAPSKILPVCSSGLPHGKPIGGSGATVSSDYKGENAVGTLTYSSQQYPTHNTVPKSPERSIPAAPGCSIPFCWALVEFETTNDEPSAYTVIDSSQIIEIARDTNRPVDEGTQRKRDSALYTGKMIHVMRGRYIMPATIVIISEDKNFIETELQQLRIMAANNLIAKSSNRHQYHPKQPQQGQPYYSKEQSGSTQQTQATKPASRQFPDDHENENGRAKRYRNDSGSENLRILGPTEPDVSNVYRDSMAGANVAVPVKLESSGEAPLGRTMAARVDRINRMSQPTAPMTFDQQTQTTNLSTENNSYQNAKFYKILSYLESVMAEQKGSRMENEYNRKLLYELHEKMQVQEKLLKSLCKQVAALQDRNATTMSTRENREPDTIENYQPPSAGAEVVVMRAYETSCENRELADHKTGSNSDQWTTISRLDCVGELQQDVNSNQSWSSSVNAAIVIDDHASRNGVASVSMDDLKTNSEMQFEPLDSNYTGDGRVVVGKSASSIEVYDMIKHDWDDSLKEDEKRNDVIVPDGQNEHDKRLSVEMQMDDVSGDRVAIGGNNTLVRKSVLEQIKWTNYKCATRKLLLEVFSREQLASHSLSGRPSPAYVTQSDKPVKDRLDPKVVADVVEIICKRCHVEESMVRAVITTKCADENKMLRQRIAALAKKNVTKGKLVGQSTISDEKDKENVSNI